MMIWLSTANDIELKLDERNGKSAWTNTKIAFFLQGDAILFLVEFIHSMLTLTMKNAFPFSVVLNPLPVIPVSTQIDHSVTFYP